MTDDAILTGSGPTRMADQDLCIAVGEDLTATYPGYDWCVGANHEAGVLHIDLICDKPLGLQNHGYLLHIANVIGPGGQKRVRDAGGELLERFGLRRDRADAEWRAAARENGLDTGNAVLKSRH